MAPKKPAAPPPPPPPPPDEEEIDLFQNPIKKVPVKYLWMGIFLLTLICLIILFLTIKAYNALLAEDWSPYDVPMKKLRTTLSVGLRNRNVMYYQNPLKVSAIVEDIPQHIKDSEEAYRAEKKKYQALYKRGVKFGNDWKLFGWNFYYVSKANERKTWHDAEYFCKSRDSHLTSVLNEEEQKYLSSKLNESAWIGLTDANVEGYWEWSDNSRLIVKYWAEGNPNGSVRDGEADEDCAAINPSGSDLNWIDANCQELKRWVCKETIEFENT